MFINITTDKGNLILNGNNITVLRAVHRNNKYYPMVAILPGKEFNVVLDGAPYDTELECLNALRTLVGETPEANNTFVVSYVYLNKTNKVLPKELLILAQPVEGGSLAVPADAADLLNLEEGKKVKWYTYPDFKEEFDPALPITKNTKVYVKIEDLEEFTVTFNSDGGSTVASQTVEEGSKVTRPDDPTKEGHTFIEWQLNNETFDFDTLITEEIVLTALWEVNEYTITFNTDGGNTLADLTLDFNSEITLPTPVKEGHTFKGWLLDNELFNLTNMPATDLLLVALWEVNEYTISFNTDGGEPIANITLDFNSEIELPTPVKEGYTFVGWLLDGSLFNLTNMPATDLLLVADWEEIIVEHTVTFDSDGGTPIAAQTIEEGSKVTRPDDPTKEGFNFLGWLIGDDEFDFDTEITEDLTLVAKWEEVEEEEPEE